MMATKLILFPPEMINKVNKAKGLISFNAWVRNAVEQQLKKEKK